MIKKLASLAVKYENYISPGTLVVGFIFDSLTLTRADTRLDNAILLTYLLLAGICILILNGNETGRIQNEKVKQRIVLIPFVIQFLFGGLFSGFTVLYSRSSSFGASWPFICVLASLLVGNEYLRNRYTRLVFQVSVYFIAIFSYLIFAIPVLLNEVGPVMFILSGVMALILTGILIYFLFLIAPQILNPYKRSLGLIIIIIYLGFNSLYFLNIIPPIPLVLKEAIPTHGLMHSGSNIVITYEPSKWYHLFKDYNPTYHRAGNNPIYIYSSVYAPVDIGTIIIHEWEYRDEYRDKWINAGRFQYHISGGREEGFRGYSLKNNVTPGKWRVSIKTKTGQTLGRIKFNVVAGSPENLTSSITH